MSDFQCKFYLLDGAETFSCKEGDAEYVMKIADRPFPDSLLSFVYYDINSWELRFHEAERELIKFYQTRDTTCLKPVQKLLDDFKDGIAKIRRDFCRTRNWRTFRAISRPCSSKFCACSRRFWTQVSQTWTFLFECRRMSRLRPCRNLTSSR